MTRIRAAIASDAEALAELSGQLGYPTTASAVAERLRAVGADAGCVVLVADADDRRVVGVAQALAQRFISEDPFGELAVLIVDDRVRGTGVGAALLAAVEAWARAQGFGSMYVRSSVVRERAHRFYLREGYAERKRQAVFVKRL